MVNSYPGNPVIRSEKLRGLDQLIAQGEALLDARRKPRTGLRTFADFGEAYALWYGAGEALVAKISGHAAAGNWGQGWCRAMHTLHQDAAGCLKEHERQQAMLVELRRGLAGSVRIRGPAKKPRTCEATEAQLLADLRRVAKALGKKTVSAQLHRRKGRFSAEVIRRRFETWNNALAKAGLEISRQVNISNRTLFDNLARVRKELGRPPALSDMVKPRSKFSSRVYADRFGGWSRALEAFDAWVETGRMPPEPVRRVRDPDRVGAALRWAVLKRDHHKCVVCGRSPAKDPSVELHIDHMVPRSGGGRTRLENLRTLCAECNRGKADRV